MSYVVLKEDGEPHAVFTGDTMFVGGCGNFNSGTPEQMFAALHLQIGSLPDSTLVFVGHEYTLSNLRFAAVVEPENAAIAARLKWAEGRVAEGLATVPSTIKDERECNPFSRACAGVPSVLAFAQEQEPVAALAAVRRIKSDGSWRALAAK